LGFLFLFFFKLFKNFYQLIIHLFGITEADRLIILIVFTGSAVHGISSFQIKKLSKFWFFWSKFSSFQVKKLSEILVIPVKIVIFGFPGRNFPVLR